MSTTTNILRGLKQLFHDKGSNSTDVSDSVDNLSALTVTVPVSASANTSLAYQADEDLKLVSAHFAAAAEVTSAAGDDVLISVVTNGVTVASYNSNTSADDELAANSYTDLSVDSSNSFVDADEYCNVTITSADATNNFPVGHFVLRFERQ